MTAEQSQPPSFTLNKFNGTNSQFANDTMPPDSGGAVSYEHYVEFLNGVFTVYDKFTHVKLAQLTDHEFWTQAGISDPRFLVDPRVVFVPKAGKYGHGQWLVVQLGMGHSVYIACTDPKFKYPSPLPGQWRAAQFDLPGNDFTQVGFDGTGIYLTVQKSMSQADKPDAESKTDADTQTVEDKQTIAHQSKAEEGAFGRWSQFVFMPQASILAFPPQVGPDSGLKIFDPLNPDVYGSGLYPVADMTGSAWEFANFICVNNITRRHLTYAKMMVPQRVLVNHQNIPIEPVEIMPFTRGKQPAGSAADRVTYYVSDIAAAPQSDGFNVWLTHTIKKNDCLAVRWYRLAIDPVTRDLSLANWGELYDKDRHYDYYNSSIASFGKDDYTVICFTRSGDATTPTDPNNPKCGNIGAYAAIIREDGSQPTIVPVQSGLANNFLPRPQQDFARWGDYSTIWRDPDYNSRNMWMINQYVTQGGTASEWCEIIGCLHIDAPA